MKILYITNTYPVKNIGTPIVQSVVDAYKRIYPTDDVCLFIARIGNDQPNLIFKIIELVKLKNKHFDIIHFHFGGIYVLLLYVFLKFNNRKSKFVITYHGTELHGRANSKGLKKIWIYLNRIASLNLIKIADRNEVVSENLLNSIPSNVLGRYRAKIYSIALGVDYERYYPIDKVIAKQQLNLDFNTKYILFGYGSKSLIKRIDKAYKIIDIVNGVSGANYELLIMTGVENSVVNYFYSACEFVLITSDAEGSPNIVKESIATNLPIYSMNAGDIWTYLSQIPNSLKLSSDVDAAAQQILNQKNSVLFNSRDFFRNQIELSNYIENQRNNYKYILNEDAIY